MSSWCSWSVFLVKLAIFAATRWECNAVRRAFLVDQVRTESKVKCIIGRSGQAQIFLFRTGMGPHKAAEVCQTVLSKQTWDLVISTGFAAALTPSKIGAIVVADQVLMEPSILLSHQQPASLMCHPEFTQEVFNVGRSIDKSASLGRVLTVPRIVNRAIEKRELARKTGAIGLDMESAAVGQVAEDQKIPFVVVRAISDLIDEDLPEVFNAFLRPFGWVQGLPSVLRSPKCWADLIRLRNQMVRTSGQVTKFFQVFFRQRASLEKATCL